jgi:hypothetical protein
MSQEGTTTVHVPGVEGQGTDGTTAVKEAMMVARLFNQRT